MSISPEVSLGKTQQTEFQGHTADQPVKGAGGYARPPSSSFLDGSGAGRPVRLQNTVKGLNAMNIEEIEAKIVGLRAELAATEAQLPGIEAALQPAEVRLQDAQRRYDDAAGLWARAQQDAGGGVFNTAGAGQLRERRPGDLEQAAKTARDAEVVFMAARDALQEALINRNSINTRRGDILMHARFLTGQIEMATRDLDRVRAAAEQAERDQVGLLARIRSSLGGAA